MNVQLCVNCNAQAGYPHAADCAGPRFWGEPTERRQGGDRRAELEAENGRLLEALELVAQGQPEASVRTLAAIDALARLVDAVAGELEDDAELAQLCLDLLPELALLLDSLRGPDPWLPPRVVPVQWDKGGQR